jgi:hypothetical protein
MRQDVVWPNCQPNTVKAVVVGLLQDKHAAGQRFDIKCKASCDTIARAIEERCTSNRIKVRKGAALSTLHNVCRDMDQLNGKPGNSIQKALVDEAA